MSRSSSISKYDLPEGKGEGSPLPYRCRGRVNSLHLPACGFSFDKLRTPPAPGDLRLLALNEGTRWLPSLATFQSEGNRVVSEGLAFDSGILHSDGVFSNERSRRVSGCFRTDQGAKVYARLQAVISTCRKQERNIFATLRALFAHQPVSHIAGT